MLRILKTGFKGQGGIFNSWTRLFSASASKFHGNFKNEHMPHVVDMRQGDKASH